jgi:AraC-like DNA-binding protein
LTDRANLRWSTAVEYSVSVLALRAAIFAASVRSGRPTAELAMLVRVPLSALADPDARVSHDHLCRAWAALVRETGEPALGIVAAARVDNAASDPLQPLLASVATVGEQMRTFLRFQRLYHSGNASRAEATPSEWVLAFALRSDASPSPELVDFVLATWLRRLRRSAGRKVPLLGARLRRGRPTHQAPYVEAFGGAIEFDADDDALRFPPDAPSLPVAEATIALERILTQQAEAALAGLDPDAALLYDARLALETELALGHTNVNALAKSLGTSARTLQRRLAARRTTFQDLLDDVRRELALGHLARGRSVTDTAFLLGFSELSAFSRAFRRWTGRAPSAARV